VAECESQPNPVPTPLLVTQPSHLLDLHRQDGLFIRIADLQIRFYRFALGCATSTFYCSDARMPLPYTRCGRKMILWRGGNIGRPAFVVPRPRDIPGHAGRKWDSQVGWQSEEAWHPVTAESQARYPTGCERLCASPNHGKSGRNVLCPKNPGLACSPKAGSMEWNGTDRFVQGVGN